jgi:hypothetical protein
MVRTVTCEEWRQSVVDAASALIQRGQKAGLGFDFPLLLLLQADQIQVVSFRL